MKSKTLKGSRSLKAHEEDDPIFSKKPKIVIRRSVKQNSKIQLVEKEQSVVDTEKIEQVNTDHNSTTTTLAMSENGSETSAESSPVNGSNPSSMQLPSVSGFDFDGVSRNQQYVLRNMLVLCDCCVQASPDGIFDVLARNFSDTGALMWWLRKVGKFHVAELVKGKDLVDAIRKAAHELYRDLKKEIGRPVARW